jgi:hypothetical protein
MAEVLDVLIRKYAGPVAKQAGIARKGRFLRLQGETAHTLLHFERHHDVDLARTVFEVWYGVIPLSYWSFLKRRFPAGTAPEVPGWGGIYRDAYLMPPDAWSYAPDETPPYTFRRRWVFDNATGLDACGTALAEALRDEVFPRMRWLLDKGNVLAEFREPTFTSSRGVSGIVGEIILTVDDVEPDELERLLSGAGKQATSDFRAWARARIARRVSAE